ncbi:hypothetical protein SprV_0301175500 [Sparganum proliferum]
MDMAVEEEEEEEEDGSGGSGERSELVGGVEDEEGLGGGTTVGAVRVAQLQDATKTTEVEVVESACLLRIHRPSLSSVQQRREDDGLVYLRLRAELETVTIPNCVLKAAEGLTGFGDPVGDFVIDFGVSGEGAAQIRKVFHHLQLGSIHAELRRIVGGGCVGWWLMHDHRLFRVDDQTEVLAGRGEEIHASLHVRFRGGVNGAVVGEEKFVNGGCGYARLEVHPPSIEELAVRPVGDADPRAFFTAVEEDASKDVSGDVQQGDAAVLVTELEVSFPLVEMHDYDVFEIMRDFSLTPQSGDP